MNEKSKTGRDVQAKPPVTSYNGAERCLVGMSEVETSVAVCGRVYAMLSSGEELQPNNGGEVARNSAS